MDSQNSNTFKDKNDENNLSVPTNFLPDGIDSKQFEIKLKNYDVALNLLSSNLKKLHLINTLKVRVKKRSYYRRDSRISNIHKLRLHQQKIRKELVIIKKLHSINLKTLKVINKMYEKYSDLEKLLLKSHQLTRGQRQQLESFRKENECLRYANTSYRLGLNFLTDAMDAEDNEIVRNTHPETGIESNALIEECHNEENSSRNQETSEVPLTIFPFNANSSNELNNLSKIAEIADMTERQEYVAVLNYLKVLKNKNLQESLFPLNESEFVPIVQSVNMTPVISKLNEFVHSQTEESDISKLLQNIYLSKWSNESFNIEVQEVLDPLQMPMLKIIDMNPRLQVVSYQQSDSFSPIIDQPLLFDANSEKSNILDADFEKPMAENRLRRKNIRVKTRPKKMKRLSYSALLKKIRKKCKKNSKNISFSSIASNHSMNSLDTMDQYNKSDIYDQYVRYPSPVTGIKLNVSKGVGNYSVLYCDHGCQVGRDSGVLKELRRKLVSPNPDIENVSKKFKKLPKPPKPLQTKLKSNEKKDSKCNIKNDFKQSLKNMENIIRSYKGLSPDNCFPYQSGLAQGTKKKFSVRNTNKLPVKTCPTTNKMSIKTGQKNYINA